MAWEVLSTCVQATDQHSCRNLHSCLAVIGVHSNTHSDHVHAYTQKEKRYILVPGVVLFYRAPIIPESWRAVLQKATIPEELG